MLNCQWLSAKVAFIELGIHNSYCAVLLLGHLCKNIMLRLVGVMDSFFRIFLSQPAREWITLTYKICLFLSKEKPRMFLVPNEEISSVSYGYEVNVRCTASGFPRPTITLLVNQLSPYTVEGTHLFMSPYEANMTFVVKMTSDVECHVSNRLESSFSRIRINLKGLFLSACSDCITLSVFFSR